MTGPRTLLQGTKQCRRCKCIKTIDQFARYYRTADGRQAYCRNCNRVTRRFYRLKKRQS